MGTPSCTLAIGIQNGLQDKNNGGIEPNCTQLEKAVDNVDAHNEVELNWAKF